MANRNYPAHSLAKALAVAEKIKDVHAGGPAARLLVADALDIKPASSNFKTLLSSSRSYGLTEGTEKAAEISLTDLGKKITAISPPDINALRQAVLNVALFKNFYERYNGNKLPAGEMMQKVLVTSFDVPQDRAAEAAAMIQENGKYVQIIRSISGSLHVMLDAPASSNGSTPKQIVDTQDRDDEQEIDDTDDTTFEPASADSPSAAGRAPIPPVEEPKRAKPIFIGHGGQKAPREELTRFLDKFRIPYRLALNEPNLGRPIPQKVREVMLQCGSAILIFTKDQKFTDDEGKEIWRPSENVGHELGAASFAYEDRIVILKEKGITLPSNYSSIGHIEFDGESIAAKTTELLGELIGFGLVTITPAA